VSAITLATSGPTSRQYGEAVLWRATILADLHRDADALAEFDKAEAIVGHTTGDVSVAAAEIQVSRAEVLARLGRFAEARPLVDASLATIEKLLGRDHPWTAERYRVRGVIELATGDADAALTSFEHARRVVDRRDHALIRTLADVDFDEARALTAAHRDPARARTLAESARDAYREYPELDARRREIDRWIAR
jgi:tetratricopeptide (TPR) repeat protein